MMILLLGRNTQVYLYCLLPTSKPIKSS